MLNAFQVHCQEFDCVREPVVLHPMATLLPAALAYAERTGGVCGKALLTAVTVGVDVAGWLGIASTQALRFFRPATAGWIWCRCGRCLSGWIRCRKHVRTFGLQYAQTSGTMQAHIEASPALSLQVGFNSRAALQAVDLSTGLAAPRGSIDGRFGYLPLMEGGYTPDEVNEQLGRVWLVAGLAHKTIPAGPRHPRRH